MNAGLYSQWTHKILSSLSYTLGVRYELNQLNNESYTYRLNEEDVRIEENSITEGKPVFRAGLNYSLFKGNNLRMSIGQGYRFPTVAEKFTVTNAGGLVILPNPELEAETGHSAEIGIRQEFQNYFISSFIDIAGFYSEYNNMIEYQINSDASGFIAENVGDTRIPGIEMSWGTQWDVGKLKIQSLLGYTHINPTYRNFTDEIKFSGTSDENILKYRYRNSFKSGLNLEIYKIELWVNQRYNSHMVSIDRSFSTFINGIAAFRDLNNKGYNVLDARIGYKWKNFSFSINMNNILNATYTERPALLEAPRNISFRFAYDSL
jgi:iron complex outermembrane receptor protein